MGYAAEIPRRSWFAYFELLSERASSHPLRLEVEDGPGASWRMEQALPLVGIDVESREQGSLEVTLGTLRREFTHHISDPEHVHLLMDDEGNIQCIRIEDRDGVRSLLYFEGEEPVPAWFHAGADEAASWA
jgi:hypothetical protein